MTLSDWSGQTYGSARLSVAASRPGLVVGDHTGTFRCASILKPLYAWVGDATTDEIRAMVTYSDNQATTDVVNRSGGIDTVLSQIETRTGVKWVTPVNPGRTWGGVTISAGSLASAMEALTSDTGPRARGILAAMRDVPAQHRFGVSDQWGTLTDQDPRTLLVKAGWFMSADELHLRTHVMALGPTASVFVLTGVPVTPAAHREYYDTLDSNDRTVVPFHARKSCVAITEGIRRAYALL